MQVILAETLTIISMKLKENVLVNFIGCHWIACLYLNQSITVRGFQCSDWLGVSLMLYSGIGSIPSQKQNWELGGEDSNLPNYQNWGFGGFKFSSWKIIQIWCVDHCTSDVSMKQLSNHQKLCVLLTVLQCCCKLI